MIGAKWLSCRSSFQWTSCVVYSSRKRCSFSYYNRCGCRNNQKFCSKHRASARRSSAYYTHWKCLASVAEKKDFSNHKITSRTDDYSTWYLDIIQAAELADQSAVKGCLVIRPYGYAIWELIRDELDRLIKSTGAVNAYFPLFIPQSFLSKEADHVEGFAKECAVVTHHRLRSNGKSLEPDPDAVLEEPLVVRPTSETIIWNMFRKWINSYRDLPLCINQWANVVRWELRTRPFLRTTEFLWQEGHTAHTTSEEAISKAKEMLEVYAELCESRNFDYRGHDANRWALQSGTSHFLGQNFSKAFGVSYMDKNGQEQLVWATSWGASTRLLGALIMTHSDDTGLVLPPKVAPIQVVVVPIWKSEDDKQRILQAAGNIVKELKEANLRVHLDDREYVRPGGKYFEWERKGVPIRLEIGSKDLARESVTCALRTKSNGKMSIKMDDKLAENIQTELLNVQQLLFKQAKERLASCTFTNITYEEMKRRLNSRDIGEHGFFLVPWKCDAKNEEKIKSETKATIRCYPFDCQHLASNAKCFFSGEPATHMAIFSRAY
eukprot:jgi/Galph1/2071/GphlegSOOS_G742.1